MARTSTMSPACLVVSNSHRVEITVLATRCCGLNQLCLLFSRDSTPDPAWLHGCNVTGTGLHIARMADITDAPRAPACGPWLQSCGGA